ncbi:transglutaminaseTgpA domain-containing protein [Streptomyces sp. H10-C2]|uniref:transglutaminaseTgpA domain-containing protein n=1 Tax=unclassified Streptomyces TaxID=2593676 RepID=UPI0024BB141F|nr:MULTISPECIES: transglutaminaseTgpA domain-containing protein [unclassified Streptomyces]MDJ0341973.1 transglutaminaseTgpA domain-containing protein [Streptomyces sp. PH10-H1]MDJ0369946.1 transglutaminaseTgpA domain-containing protein [Streptomyces sp. H10-C2]MDJ0370053.1 transglutaminaseTgpA domain-containing protein [Streptomyces sp. H10-C2]
MSATTRPARTAPLPPQGGGPNWDWAAPAPTGPSAERPKTPAASGGDGLGRARRLWSLLPVAALLAASGFGFHRVFTTRDLLPVLTVSVLAPVALSAALSGVLSRKGRISPLWPSLVLTTAAWVGTVWLTMFRAGGPRAIWPALLDAPHAILTTILPVPGEARLLVLPHAVLWLAAFASAELALRTRTPLLPALPAVLAFGFPLVLGVDGPGSNYAAAAALAALTALLALIRSRVRLSPRGLALGLPIVLGLTLVAALTGPNLPGIGASYDPRDAITPPTVHPESISPLDQVAALMRSGDAKVFTVHSTAETNYRLAVLDTYNGTTWSSTAKLSRTGGRVPAEPGVDPGKRQTLTQRFTVQALPGIWLPAADRPSAVTLPDHTVLSVDPASGVLATDRTAPSGFSYTAESQLPVYDVQRLQYAPAANDPALVELPRTDAADQPIPSVASFTKIAAKATEGSTFPFQQAVKLADWLRGSYEFDPRAIPGHTYRGLEFFLTEGKRGTSEQFAASFAVLARTLGLPSRVVVGFRPGTKTGDDTWQVAGKDVLAWPEVEFKGIGWVPFYPTPGTTSKDGSSVAPAGQPKDRKSVDQQITDQPRPTAPPKAAATPRTVAAPAAGPRWWIYAPAGVFFLLLGYLLYAAWLPWRRRARRRGAADVRQRVLGAWQQIVDRLTEIGLPATGAHTAEEVAAFGASRVGGAAGEHLPDLARLVNEVGYAGRTPDPASADAAWAHCDAIEGVVLSTIPRRDRIRRALRLRRG